MKSFIYYRRLDIFSSFALLDRSSILTIPKKKLRFILHSFSEFEPSLYTWIQIRIQQLNKYGSNADPDPHPELNTGQVDNIYDWQF